MKKVITSILALSMLLLLVGCSSNTAKNTIDKGSILYNMKINPEFEISADDDLVVVDVVAKNIDAENVLASVNVVGISVNEAFNILAEEAKAQGYLTEENGNTVNITILEKDDEKMPTCHLCNGCGTVMCLECQGTGILDTCVLCGGKGYFHCDVCNDTGFIACNQCGGSGYTSVPNPGCWACHGSGVCYFCGGAGYVVVTAGDTGNVVYKEDGTPETEVCVYCKGAKYCVNCLNIPCNRCNHEDNGPHPGLMECNFHNSDFALGSQCPDCHGAGIIYCGDSFNGYNWCPCCWGSGVEGTGDPNYRDYYPDPTE